MHSKNQLGIFVGEIAGKKFVGDPLKIIRKMAAEYPEASDPEHDQKILQLTGPLALKAQTEATDRLLHAARVAMNLPDLAVDDDGNVTGYAEADVLALWQDFGEYLVKKNESINNLLTSPKSTESESSTPHVPALLRAKRGRATTKR